MSGFGIRAAFDIGKKALRSQLAGLNITSNNIANVNTEGYSRQQVVLKPDIPFVSPEGVFGSGVVIDGVRRIRDNLVDNQLRQELQTKSQEEILERILNQIETTINEPSDTGFRVLLSQFFDNFAAVANNPEDTTTRFNLREQASVLVNSFHRIDEQFRILSDDLEFEIERSVERLNSVLNTIAELNTQVQSLEGISQGSANDLRDERDRLIDELATLVDMVAFEKNNGVVEIASPSQSLVTGNFATEFEIKTFNEDGNLKSIILSKESGQELLVKNGKISGLKEAKNTFIPLFRGRFNELASELINSVNSFHRNGVGLKGTANTFPTDNNFFSGTNAVNIDLDFAIKDSENAIAAAGRIVSNNGDGTTTVSGQPGDNRIALEIADLKQRRILNNGTQSLLDFLNSVIGEVGIATAEARDNVVNQQQLITQFQNLRDSNSAVSLDEEFVNLIKFQRGFQAASRVITTVDEMFETLINI